MWVGTHRYKWNTGCVVYKVLKMIQSQWERLVVFDGRQLGGGVAAAVQTGKSDQHSPLSNQGEQEEGEETLVELLWRPNSTSIWNSSAQSKVGLTADLYRIFQSNHGDQHM